MTRKKFFYKKANYLNNGYLNKCNYLINYLIIYSYSCFQKEIKHYCEVRTVGVPVRITCVWKRRPNI